MKLTFIKTWEASGNAVFEPDMIVAKAYKSVFASYKPKHFLYYQKNNKNKLGEAYDSLEELDKFDTSGFRDFQNKEYVKKFFQGISKAIKDNQKITDNIRKSPLKSFTNKELSVLLKQSVGSMKLNFSYILACQPQRFTSLENWIKNVLLKNVEKNKIDEVFRVLSTPIKSTPIADEQLDWLKLMLKVKLEKPSAKNKELAEQIIKHQDKYSILGAADGRDPWTVGHFMNAMKSERRSVKALKLEIVKCEKRQKKLKEKQALLISKYQVSNKAQHYCLLLAKVGHRRLLLRIQGWMPLYQEIKKVLHVVAKRHGYNQEIIRYCTVDELIDLSEGKLIEKDLLQKRKKSFLLIYSQPNVHILSGKKANEKFEKLVPKEDFKKIKEVKGVVAKKGRVIGKVLLFQWGDNMQEKIKKIKKDDKIVLVTGQTRPQLMPLITKCSAIVTDEGGIISHSAIVSRELGIPCIVGTRIGARVFKDNDVVEVNANSGKVKIIR